MENASVGIDADNTGGDDGTSIFKKGVTDCDAMASDCSVNVLVAEESDM